MKSPNWDILQACEFFALLASYLFIFFNVCIRRDEDYFKHVSRGHDYQNSGLVLTFNVSNKAISRPNKITVTIVYSATQLSKKEGIITNFKA